MNPANLTLSSARNEAFWDRYRDEMLAACGESETDRVGAIIWARLHDRAGPPIDFLHNEEPVILLRWVLSHLPAEVSGRMGQAAFELLHKKVSDASGQMSESPFVYAVSDLCEFLELGRAEIVPPPNAVHRLLEDLFDHGQPTHLAKTLHDLKTRNGDRLLSDVLRALALFTDASMGGTWRKLLTSKALEGSAVPVFMGYARAIGEKARDGLPWLARALARPDQPEPETLAAALKAFATAAYSDTAYDPAGTAICMDDLCTLFGELPGTTLYRDAFIRATFDNLAKLRFRPDDQPLWRTAVRIETPVTLMMQFLTYDIGDRALSLFRALIWGVGKAARVALPLVARALAPLGHADVLADALVSIRDSDVEVGPARGRVYRREILDAGDFFTLFALVPRDNRAEFARATFAALELRNVEPSQLEVWKDAAATPLSGILWDSIDSPSFAKFPALHALLVPALAAVDPAAYEALRGVYLNSSPVLELVRARQLQPIVLGLADRLLYAPGPELTEYVARVKIALRQIPCQFVAPGGEYMDKVALDTARVLPSVWRLENEYALLSVIMPPLDVDVGKVTADLLSLFNQQEPALLPRQSGDPVGSVVFESVDTPGLPIVTASPAATPENAAEQYLRTLRKVRNTTGKKYRPKTEPAFDPHKLLEWLRFNINRLLGVEPGLPSNIYCDPTGDLEVYLSTA
jgi:hypothetical protein